MYGSFELSGIKPAPAGATPIEVTFDYDRSRTLSVTAKDIKNNIVQKVELHKGECIAEANSVQATDFYLLLDVSGSMSYENKMKEAKRASLKLIQETLDLNLHRLGIITFGSNERMLCELTNDKGQLMLAIDSVDTSGSTKMDLAIIRAEKELEKSNNKKAIILITDGEPDNKGATERAAESARQR